MNKDDMKVDESKEGNQEARANAQDSDSRLAESQKKIKELEDRLMRLAAEFENYKKRASRENEMLRENSSAEVILKFLPIVDEFEIAMTHIDKASSKEFKLGMELIYAKLLETLKKEGVEQMKANGQSFNPYSHDALRQGEGEEGKVVEEVVKGYTFKGKVLRHAKVVVGLGKKESGDHERN